MRNLVIPAFVCLTMLVAGSRSVAQQIEAENDDVVGADAVILLGGYGDNAPECPCAVDVADSSIDLDYSSLPDAPFGETRIVLRLGTQTFEIEVAPYTLDSGLVFLRFDFGDRAFYGVRQSSGVANVYNHYFHYDGNRFHYLGAFPELLYNRPLDLYVSYERIMPYYVETRYFFSVTTKLWTTEVISTGGPIEKEFPRPPS